MQRSRLNTPHVQPAALHHSYAAIRYAMYATLRNPFNEIQSSPDVEETFIAALSLERNST